MALLAKLGNTILFIYYGFGRRSAVRLVLRTSVRRLDSLSLRLLLGLLFARWRSRYARGLLVSTFWVAHSASLVFLLIMFVMAMARYTLAFPSPTARNRPFKVGFWSYVSAITAHGINEKAQAADLGCSKRNAIDLVPIDLAKRAAGRRIFWPLHPPPRENKHFPRRHLHNGHSGSGNN